VIPDERWDDRSAEIFASDANAWIEVYVPNQGWMPVDVSPERSRVPQEVEESTESQGVPVADPPKPPELPDEQEPPEIETPEDEEEPPEQTDEDEAELEPPSRFTAVQAALGAAGAGLGALMLIAGSIVGYKALRRRRRRRADQAAVRIAGAWAELIDRVDEAGGGLPSTATPAEAAAHAKNVGGLSQQDAAAQVGHLADRVSTAAFHPRPPSMQNADDAWRTYDQLVSSLKQDAGFTDRIRRAVDPRTLRDDVLTGSR